VVIEMFQDRLPTALSRKVRTVVCSLVMALLGLVTALGFYSSASPGSRKLRFKSPLTKVSIWLIYIMFKIERVLKSP
jgi:TRAP-type C4-dicarboxylate transport system permease small subunit